MTATFVRRTVAAWVTGGVLLGALSAQDVTLAQCETSARSHHPLGANGVLIDQKERSGLEASTFQYLPRLSLSGKATKQSESAVAGELDQWQVTADVSQLLFDGGAIEAQKRALAAGASLERHQLEVNLEALRSQVRQTYFTIILLDSQAAQNRLLARELADSREKRRADLVNGVAIPSDIDAIRVEELKAAARDADLAAGREAAVSSLSRLTGLALGPETRFLRPEVPMVGTNVLSDSRKEFGIYQGREAAAEADRGALLAGLFPRVTAFAQVGEGLPGLNSLKAVTADWWIVGIRGTVALDNLYTFGAQSQKISATLGQIENDRAAFRLAEQIKIDQKRAEIGRLEKAIVLDLQTIELRRSIKAAAEAKAENGVISVNDLVREINEESLAEETKILHEVQLLAARSELSLIIGNGDLP